MRTRARAAGVCAAVTIALAGGATVAPGVAHAELPGVCGTLVGAGLTVAAVARTMVQRGAGFVGAVVSVGCFGKDAVDYAGEVAARPENVAQLELLRERYRGYQVADFMREFGCDPVTRGPANPDDVNDHAVTSWDCGRSPYAQGD